MYIIQISFTTSSEGPDREQLYPYYFHMLPNLSNVALAIANFITYDGFEWGKVVILTQDQDNYKKVHIIINVHAVSI